MKRLDEVLEFLFHTKRGILTLVLGGMSSAMLFGGCFVTDCFACVCDSSCDGGWTAFDDCVNDCVSCDGECDNTLCTGLFGAGCVTDCGDNECGLSCNASDWDCANDCEDGDCNWSCGGFSCANGVFRSDYVEPHVTIDVVYYNISTGSTVKTTSKNVYYSNIYIYLDYDSTYYTSVGVYSSTSTSSTQIADSDGIFTDDRTGADFSDGDIVYVLLEENYYGQTVTFNFSATVDGDDISTNPDFSGVSISGSMKVKVGYTISGMPDAPEVEGYTFSGWYIGDTKVSSYLVDGKTLHLYNLGTTATSIKVVAKYIGQTFSVNVKIGGSSQSHTVKSGTTIGDLLETYNVKEDINTNYGRYLGVAYSSSATEYLSEDTVIAGNCSIYVFYDKYVSVTINNADGPDSGSEVLTGYCVGDTLTLSTDNIAGYYFAGWYYDSSYSSYVVDYEIELEDQDYTFYVKWSTTTQVRVEYYDDSALSTLLNLVYYDFNSSSTTALWMDYDVPTGYDLTGWCRYGSTIPMTSLPSGSAGNIQLYASISAKTYTVYLDANGGTVSSSYAYISYGQTGYYIAPPDTRTGYTFLGWYYGNTKVTDEYGDAVIAFTESVFGATAMSGDTLTLTAKWNSEQIYVYYYINGTRVHTNNYEYDALQSASLWTNVSSYVSVGYTFNGWVDSTGAAVTELWATTDDIYLYADITVNTYTIILDANGGTINSLASYTTTLTYGDNYYLATPDTRTGYTFLGWYYGNTKVTDEYGESLSAFTSSVFGTTALSGDTLTLTAKWESEKIYVYYYVDTTCVHTDSYEYDDLLSASLWSDISSYVAVGYTFNGWKDSTGTIVTEFWATTENIDLTADITAKTYTIILDANGGTINSQVSDTTTLTYGIGYYLGTPVRDGYTFAGWYYGSTKVTDEYGESLGDFTADTLGSNAFANDTLTFSARWMANSAAAQGVEAVSNNYAVAAVKIEEDDK